VDVPPRDPDEWTDEQWQEHLRSVADEDDAPPAEPGALQRAATSSLGTVLGAGMLGLERAMYGERPKDEVVAEAESDDPDRDLSRFDPDDPTSSVIHLVDDDRGGDPACWAHLFDEE
jgi:hypothetical protein